MHMQQATAIAFDAMHVKTTLFTPYNNNCCSTIYKSYK